MYGENAESEGFNCVCVCALNGDICSPDLKVSFLPGLSGLKVEAISEEKASRCLQRINLISTVREEVYRSCQPPL